MVRTQIIIKQLALIFRTVSTSPSPSPCFVSPLSFVRRDDLIVFKCEKATLSRPLLETIPHSAAEKSKSCFVPSPMNCDTMCLFFGGIFLTLVVLSDVKGMSVTQFLAVGHVAM